MMKRDLTGLTVCVRTFGDRLLSCVLSAYMKSAVWVTLGSATNLQTQRYQHSEEFRYDSVAVSEVCLEKEMVKTYKIIRPIVHAC